MSLEGVINDAQAGSWDLREKNFKNLGKTSADVGYVVVEDGNQCGATSAR